MLSTILFHVSEDECAISILLPIYVVNKVCRVRLPAQTVHKLLRT